MTETQYCKQRWIIGP